MTFLKFAPYAVILALVCGVLYMRGETIKANAAQKSAESEASALRAVNDKNADTLKQIAANQAENDRIVAALADKVDIISKRDISTRTIIREAVANDPAVKSWAETPVPDSVRAALRRPGGVRGTSETDH